MNLQSAFIKIVPLFILFFFFSLTGTGFSENNFQKPRVTLKKVRILKMDQTVVALEGDLEIFNPNDLSSRFSGYRYRLDVEDQRLVTGQSDQPFAVPAQGVFALTIPANILFEDLLRLSQKDIFNRDLKYRLSGSVTMDSWMAKLPLPFSYEGTINLSERLREQLREFLEEE